MSTCTPAQLQDIGCQNQERAAVKEGKEQLKSRLGKKVAGAVDDDWQQAPAPPDLSLTPVCLCLLAGQTHWLFPSETGTSPLRERILFLCFCLFCCHPWPWLWLDYGSSLSSRWSLALTEPGRICIPDVVVMQITILKTFLGDLLNTWTPLFHTLSRLNELYIREHNAFANLRNWLNNHILLVFVCDSFRILAGPIIPDAVSYSF